MTRTLRATTWTAGLLAAAAGVISGAAPAQAAGLTVDYLLCESGTSQYSCVAGFSGGVGSTAAAWYINGTHIPDFDGRLSIFDNCTVGKYVKVKLVVTDSTGASASKSSSVLCRKIWQ